MCSSIDVASHKKNTEESEENAGAIVIDYFDKILVSYVAQEHMKGCKHCLLSRFLNTRKDRTLVKNRNQNKNYRSNHMFQKLTSLLAAALEKDNRLLDEFGRRKFYLLDKNSLALSEDYFNPVPDCEICGSLPEDSEELICSSGAEMIGAIHSDKNIPFRQENKRSSYKRLETLILNKNVGIVTTLMDSLDGPFPISVAMLPIENGKDEPGSGRTTNIEDSRAIALFEAIERYAGFRPRGKRTMLYDSYHNLRKNENYEVIDIKKLMLHEDSLSNNSDYKNPSFRFDGAKKYHWIDGYNLSKEKAVILPETLGYYGLRIKDVSYEEEHFVYEISNGCSLGSSLLEASYYGLLEVIERDAFLSCWYTSRKIKKIILDDEFLMSDHALKKEIDTFCQYYEKFKVDIYDITSDTEIPTILITITRKEIDESCLNFMCAAATDIDIYVAIEKALHEISSVFLGFEEKFEADYERIKEIAEDLTRVRDMLDHSLVYGYYKNLDKITFDKQVFAHCNISQLERTDKTSLNKAYQMILENLSRIGKDVIVVDQTSEEMRKIGLSCSKTLIPGLLSMTFDARNVRLSEERVKELQEKEQQKLTVRYIPHPFP